MSQFSVTFRLHGHDRNVASAVKESAAEAICLQDVRPLSVRPFTPFACRYISLLNGGILMKFVANIHHVRV